MVRYALLARLQAKPGKEASVEKFLTDALALANAESARPVWFAWRIGQSTLGIFDAFATDAARDAHLAGPNAAALMKNAPDLLSGPPVIEKLAVLAAKVPG